MLFIIYKALTVFILNHINYSVGAVYCNKTVPQMNEVIEQLSVSHGGFVRKGGAFKPEGCISKNKVKVTLFLIATNIAVNIWNL